MSTFIVELHLDVVLEVPLVVGFELIFLVIKIDKYFCRFTQKIMIIA